MCPVWAYSIDAAATLFATHAYMHSFMHIIKGISLLIVITGGITCLNNNVSQLYCWSTCPHEW